MTAQEALAWFKEELKDGKCSDNCRQCNAYEVAIEALEKQIAKKPVTNFERIKAMSVEELANAIESGELVGCQCCIEQGASNCRVSRMGCSLGTILWLKSEADTE